MLELLSQWMRLLETLKKPAGGDVALHRFSVIIISNDMFSRERNFCPEIISVFKVFVRDADANLYC